MNSITIKYNVYVRELTKKEHIPCPYWTNKRKSDYCV